MDQKNNYGKISQLQKELDALQARAKEELEKEKPDFGKFTSNVPETPDAVEKLPIIEKPQTSLSDTVTYAEVKSAEPLERHPLESMANKVPVITGTQPKTLTDDVLLVEPVRDDKGQVAKPKDDKKFLISIAWISGVLFVLAISSFIAYYLGVRQTKSITTPTMTPTSQVLNTPKPLPTPSTSVYRNEKYGYSFSYPTGVSVFSDVKDKDNVLYVANGVNSMVFYSGDSKFVFDKDMEPLAEGTVMIGKYTASKTLYTDFYIVYLPENDSELLQIIVKYGKQTPTPEDEKVFKDILSTLSLLEENQNASPSPSLTPKPTIKP